MHLARAPQLLLETLLLGRLLEQVPDAVSHGVERLAQLAQLVSCPDANLMTKIALPHLPGPNEELVHGTRDRLRQGEAHDQRSELDDQEQTGDGCQRYQKRIPKAHVTNSRLSTKHPFVERHRRHPNLERNELQLTGFPIGVLQECEPGETPG